LSSLPSPTGLILAAQPQVLDSPVRVFSLKIFNMEVIPFSRLKNETQNLFDQDLVVQSILIFKSDQAV
jgi:hypothetical protein